MTKADNIKKHLDDIDFRTQEERSKSWKDDFLAWHKDISQTMKVHGYNDMLAGQLTMLSSVLWYLLPPKEYKALVRGRVFIDQDQFTPAQKRLYLSMQAFGGSKYCDKTDDVSVAGSYITRMRGVNKGYMADLFFDNKELGYRIANNIVADSEAKP